MSSKLRRTLPFVLGLVLIGCSNVRVRLVENKSEMLKAQKGSYIQESSTPYTIFGMPESVIKRVYGDSETFQKTLHEFVDHKLSRISQEGGNPWVVKIEKIDFGQQVSMHAGSAIPEVGDPVGFVWFSVRKPDGAVVLRGRANSMNPRWDYGYSKSTYEAAIKHAITQISDLLNKELDDNEISDLTSESWGK